MSPSLKGNKTNKLDAADLLGRLRVVLVNSRNPLNIGAAARAMSNFGFRHLRVVTPYSPAFREARSAVGAAELLQQAQQYDLLAEAVADCPLVIGTTAVRHRVLQQRIYVPEQGSRLIRTKLASAPVALLFGSERVGLSNDDLSHCHWLIRIPTIDENISMNLGQAVAVCLYEIAWGFQSSTRSRTRSGGSTPADRASDNRQRATGAEVERITTLLNDALRESGYPGPPALNEQKIRRLVRHMGLSSLDAEVWQGVLRQLLWKLRSSQSRKSSED
jgi:TrmH family RNA methyltransferase